MQACQSNLGQLIAAFETYAQGYSGHLPGNYEDPGADWLGLRNAPTNRQPEDGTIYPFVGQRNNVYVCPSDDSARSRGVSTFSYSANQLMSGAKTEWVSGCHYRSDNYVATNHTTNMRSLPGAITLVEEDWNWYLSGAPDAAWANDDSITQRHLGQFGNVAYHDGSVGTVALPATPRIRGKYFGSNAVCIRSRGKWVSGYAWVDAYYHSSVSPNGAYGFLERAWPADRYGVIH